MANCSTPYSPQFFSRVSLSLAASLLASTALSDGGLPACATGGTGPLKLGTNGQDGFVFDDRGGSGSAGTDVACSTTNLSRPIDVTTNGGVGKAARAPGDGGRGGDVSLQANGTVAADHLFTVTSKGGAGGASTGGGWLRNGGYGQSGGTVSITNSANATLATSGILVTSEGGNGGATTASEGYGGSGANTGAVTINNQGSLVKARTGIGVTLVGGAGGDYAPQDQVFGYALGTAGYGGSTGAVTITNSGRISAGGNGDAAGSAGIRVTAQAGDAGNVKAGYSGAAGNTGPIRVTNSGAVATYSEEQDAIRIDARGGHGTNVEHRSGNGGNPGVTGDISIGNSGGMATAGDYADAISIESRAGDGGRGGDGGGQGVGGGNAGKIEVNNSGSISTQGIFAAGVYAASIAGNGEAGGSDSGQHAVGGNGGNGGRGGSVMLKETGDASISTFGDLSVGAHLLSVGGDGGRGGDASASGLFTSLAVGGSGGNGGNGGTVTVSLSDSSSIFTRGDLSSALLIESIGGGGGMGGSAQAEAAFSAIAVGGSGGTGGNGGDVTVNLEGTSNISATGNHSAGVLIHTIGGGGGVGGQAKASTVGPGLSSSIAIGGSGGGGGDGGNVTVNLGTGTAIATGREASPTDAPVDADTDPDAGTAAALAAQQGSNSPGVLIQSIGGGGGQGGTALTQSLSVNPAGSLSLGVAIGGTGGQGGAGGSIASTIDGMVTTHSANSAGLLLQSIGGGGGSGGAATSLSGSIGGEFSADLGLVMGGNGGAGGAASAVSVVGSGRILTYGDNSGAVILQSIAGGGGNGGRSTHIGVSASAGAAFNASASIGGSGGVGGDGEKLTANFAGDVETRGANSTGILLQSIGGGGGNGGSAINVSATAGGETAVSASAAIGGGGGAGGSGGAIEVHKDATAFGSVLTSGDNSSGVVAQSIGGGGGNGGTAIDVSVGATKGSSFNADIAIGGGGGAGGSGQDVTIKPSDGSITTTGNLSSGIIAQSIGGGGGNGGSAVTVTADLTKAAPTAGSTSNVALGGGISFGGGGLAGGTGGTITIDNGTQITTTGSGSLGIIAQSIGGGGGNGGAAISASAVVTQNSQKTYSANVALGGEGGMGAIGGSVSVTNRSNVLTTGDHSIGILGQSIGGGGGNGGSSTTASLSLSSNLLSFGQSSQTVSGNVALGGHGGIGGTGSAVAISNIESVTTFGDHSSAIIAQSVGGGGGNGGASRVLSVSASSTTSDGTKGTSTSTVSTDVSLGGSGGSGGTGGTVTLDNSGLLTTFGDHSNGMLAQSIGGGGGNGGSSLLLSYTKGRKPKGTGDPSMKVNSTELAVGGSGGTAMHGGAVTATNAGRIVTEGHVSAGVVMQSVGGGGGNGGTVFEYDRVSEDDSKDRKSVMGGSGGSAGDGSAVTFTGAKDMQTVIVTKGARSPGILAQSVGGGGGNAGVVRTIKLIEEDDPDGAPSEDSVETDAWNRLVGAAGAGSGGTGGNVTVSEYGTVQTLGINSQGILAQSIGGGGGTFSDVKTYNAQDVLDALPGLSSTGDRQTGLANSGTYQLGATDGAAGGARDVAVSLYDVSRIATAGAMSSGIVAQAISHGGGDVATVSGDDLMTSNASIPAAHGVTTSRLSAILGSRNVSRRLGTGIADVELDDIAAITTSGDGARGILAQSIGGGGGLFSANQASGAMASSIPSATHALTLAGFTNGGFRADGSQVDITLAGAGTTIETEGNFSHGILAQSIGAGGGSAGIVYDDDVVVGEQVLDVYLGSEQTRREGYGQYGWGGTVSVNTHGTSSTSGDQAIGIMAQAIGGGGGEVFYDVAEGRTIDLDVALGEGLAIDTHAGVVAITHQGLITTSGDLSHGIVAQSVAAGGGMMSIGDLDTVAGGRISASFGKADTPYGDGYGSSSVTLAGGTIRTTGDLAFGVLAQEVGSGGGIFSVNGGRSITPDIILNKGTTDYGSGPVAVNMDATSQIATSGVGSHGIFAQSTTGGGLALLNGTNGFTPNAHDQSQHATAGNVRVQADGMITTSGAGAHAVFATSSSGPSVVVQADEMLSILGFLRPGSGGYVGMGQASTSHIAVSGAGATGIYLVSKGRDSVVADANVAGTVTASGEGGAGIRIQNTNAFEETGLTDLSDDSTTLTSRIVVEATGQVLARDEATATDAIHIVNGLGSYGLTIKGRVAAVAADGSKTQTFDGKNNAIWAAGRGTLEIGSGGGVEGTMRFTGATTVSNAGIIDGAIHGAAAYILGGAANGAATGAAHYFEVRPSQEAAASVNAGQISLGSQSQIRPYLGEFGTLIAPVALLSATDAFVDQGAVVYDTPVLKFTTRKTNQQLFLDHVSADFTAAQGLSANAATIARLVDPLVDQWMAGAPVKSSDTALHDLLLNAANQETAAGLNKVIADNTDSSGHFGAITGHHASAISHISNIHSCGTEYGLYAAISESECKWLKGTKSYSEDLASNTTSRSSGISLGKQVAISDDWRFGIGLGYDVTNLSGDTVSADRHGIYAGAVLKYSSGGWLASAALSGSYTWGDGKRSISVLGLNAQSQQETLGVSGRLRLARQYDFGSVFAVPTIDLDMSMIHNFGYTEHGAGSLNLAVDADNDLLIDLHPQIQIGTQIQLQDEWLLRPYVEAGALFALNEHDMTQSFASGSLAGAKHSVTVDREDVKATLAAGLTVFHAGRFEAKLRYEGTLGSETRSHTGSVKIGMRF